MQLFRDLTTAYLAGPSVLTIGTFDGLHKGHQHLISTLKVAAKKQQASTVVIAFHPRPKTVLAPHLPGNDYLSTPEERITEFEDLGLNTLILTPFTRELSQIHAKDFIQMLVKQLNIVQLCVGHDFVMGKNQEGNIEKLTELGQTFNYTLHEIGPFLLDGQIVSSTAVRAQLQEGNVRHVAHLLGRYPSLRSHVVHGTQRGQTIGFPTANFFVPPERLLPANGVYATFVSRLDTQERLSSVTNIGLRPSFGGEERTVESYIFNFDEDIYGQTFNLEFVERLRPEQKFDGIEALVGQIKQDAEQARNLLTGEMLQTV